MKPQLEALLNLQDIELQIVDIRRQLTQKARFVERQTTKLNAAQDRLAVEREALRRTHIEVDEIDVDLKGRMANVSRLREHLNTVRTNKEYAAVLAQLNNEKADANRLESKALEMMEGLEARRKNLAQHEEEVRQELSRLEDLKAQAERARETFSGKASELEGQRVDALEKLDANAATHFERLSERYEGEVMAKIERTHPRRDEFACGGCHMALSAEQYNTAMMRDEIQTCRNCGRILYAPQRT